MAVVMCGCTADEIHANGPGFCVRPEVSFEGAVLETFEENGYDDSDFIAVVWDGEKVTIQCYASTRSWTYHNGARVDATSEVRAAALEWYRSRLAPVRIAEARREAERPRKGVEVCSLTTRGKNVGVKGEVRWIGPDRYSRTGGERVGLKVQGEDKLRYLPADRVRVISPDPVDEKWIMQRAATAQPRSWYVALCTLGMR